MQRAVSTTLRVGLASLILSGLPQAYAQNVDLLVKHFATSLGPDGVKRSTEFSERFARGQGSVWISRVLPSGTQADRDHAKGGEQHKHLDAATASRWISRSANGEIRLQLVPNDERLLVSVTPADYGNVGFDGSWAAAWSLIDPAGLKRMNASAPMGDLTTYTLVEGDRKLKVVWHAKLQLPMMVESSDGNSRRQTVVQVLNATTTTSRPWEQLQGFAQKDYSDYLD